MCHPGPPRVQFGWAKTSFSINCKFLTFKPLKNPTIAIYKLYMKENLLKPITKKKIRIKRVRSRSQVVHIHIYHFAFNLVLVSPVFIGL